MDRIILLIALVALFAACDDANKTAAPGKDSASATAASSATVAAVETAKAGAAKEHDCGGDCADCAKKSASGHECGKDSADCGKDCDKGCDKCGKHAEHADCQCGAGKKGETVWCDNCNAGFVDGKMITERAAFDKAKAAKK